MATSPQGFLLLTLPDAHLTSPSATEHGTLHVECVTVPAATAAERDVWLVLRLNAFEMPIAPTQPIRHARGTHTFVFASTAGDVVLALRAPASAAEADDRETFEVVLAQYGALQDAGVDSDLKGRLVLVDEDDGQVLGTLGEQFRMREDASVNVRGKEKDPVVIDLPDYDGAAHDVFVHAVPPEQQDIIMKSASLISRGIVFATGALTSGMHAASSYYTAHAKPNEEPLVFSESTRGHVRRIHRFSGGAVAVSATTTGLINDCIARAITYVGRGSGSSRPASPAAGTSAGPSLPPRKLDTPSGGLRPPPQTPAGGAPLPPRPPLLNRILLSTDLLLTTLENSGQRLVEHGTTTMSEVLGHKYGKDMGDATLLVGRTVRNVGVVYIDARGVGRRALLKTAGKTYIKARLGKREVVLGVDEHGHVADAGAGGSGNGAGATVGARVKKQ